MSRMFLILMFMFAALACNTTGPDGNQSGFVMHEVVFTGDSTGGLTDATTEVCRSTFSKSEPFIEFTVSWNDPEEGSGYTYTLYRSLQPDIQRTSSQAEEMCSGTFNVWADALNLQWGTTYYYAVRADHAINHTLWSNEVSIGAPSPPGGTPVFLMSQKENFTVCTLNWTRATGDFSSYSLYRGDSEDFMPEFTYPIYTTSNIADLTFTDSLEAPADTCYYLVAVENSHGVLAYSNQCVFMPGGDVPWQISSVLDPLGASVSLFEMNGNNQTFTGKNYFDTAWHSRVYDIVTGQPIGGCAKDSYYITGLDTGEYAACYRTEDGGRYLGIFSSSLMDELRVRNFPGAESLIQCGTCILAGLNSFSLLIDYETLETVMTIPYGFSQAELSPDGNYIYLLGENYVVCLSLPGFVCVSSYVGYFCNIDCSPDGRIHCTNSQEYICLAPVTLSLIDRFSFPEKAFVPDVIVLPPEYSTVYIPVVSEDGSTLIRIYDIHSGERLGTVSSPIASSVLYSDILVDPGGEVIWGVASDADQEQTMFRITR